MKQFNFVQGWEKRQEI